MGYRTKRTGVCLGDSIMYAQAVKAHKEKHFDDRQAAIRELLQQSADGDESITEKIQRAREKKKKKPRKTASGPDDAALLELPAYFDSIAIAQSPGKHEDVFNKKLSQADFEQIYPLIISSELEAEQKEPDPDTMLLNEVGIFNRQQFENYFVKLRNILRKAHEEYGEYVDDLPFIVVGFEGKHATAFHYNYKKDVWTFRDPNKIKLAIPTDEMASIQMRAINEPNHVGVKIFLDVTPTQKKQLPHLREALTDFQKDHTKMLAEMTSVQTDQGFTLVNYAFAYRNARALEQLRALNQEKPLKARGININFRDQQTGNTAAHFIVINNDIESFKIAVELGLDFTIADNSARTPLQYAIAYEHDELAMAIITEEAKLWSIENGIYVDLNKATALHLAILRERPQLVEHILTLLEKQGGGDEWLVKQLNVKNRTDKTAIDCVFYANNEENAVAITKRLLRCANRENKIELFQRALQHGFVKVCDMIVASLREESKIDEKQLFLQLATGSTQEDINPLDAIIALIKKIPTLNTSRIKDYNAYFYQDYIQYNHDQLEWIRNLAIRNDLFIAEIIKRHPECFKTIETREKFNAFICDRDKVPPCIYKEFLSRCESDTERSKYCNTVTQHRSKPYVEIIKSAILNGQEQIAIDLINLGVDALAKDSDGSLLEYAIDSNLTKLTKVILDKLSLVKKTESIKSVLHSPYFSFTRHETFFEKALRKGNAEQIKQLYQFLEKELGLLEKQNLFIFACQNCDNISTVRLLLDLFCPNKKNLEEVTEKYFATLSMQLSHIESIREPGSKLKTFNILLELINEHHITLKLAEKIAIFKLAETCELEKTIDFILRSFKSTAEFREFIISGRFFEINRGTDLLVKFLNAFSDDKSALKKVLYREEYGSFLENAIENNHFVRAHLFLDFLLDSFSEKEKQKIFSWAIEYKMGSIADKILATVPAERETEFLGSQADAYKKLCPSTQMSAMRDECKFQLAMADFFKDPKNAENLTKFRTAVLLGDTKTVLEDAKTAPAEREKEFNLNTFLSTTPKEQLIFYLNHRDQEGRTVLLDALLNGDEGMAFNLLQKGAKNIKDFHFQTPFTIALWLGANKVVEAILSSSTENLLTTANMTTAISKKHDDIGELFVKRGYQNSYVAKNSGEPYDPVYKSTTLHDAVKNGMEKTALALASKSDSFWNIPDTKYGKTPTHEAAILGNPIILRAAIEAKADFFMQDIKSKRTPADCLVALKNYGMLVELLEARNKKVSDFVLSLNDLDKLKEEFIQQIERQALQNPDQALARLTKACQRENLLGSLLLDSDQSPRSGLFSQSRSAAVLFELNQLKGRVEQITPKPEPGFGVL